MYAIGDKYDLSRLAKFAQSKYQEALSQSTNPKDFLSLIPLVYKSTLDSNQGIRDIVIWNTRKNYDMCMAEMTRRIHSKKYRILPGSSPANCCRTLRSKLKITQNNSSLVRNQTALRRLKIRFTSMHHGLRVLRFQSTVLVWYHWSRHPT